MKNFFVAFLTLISASAAHAQPDGTLDCTSADGSVTATFDVSNYGIQEVIGVSNLTWPAPQVEATKARILQQWVTISEANVTLSLPPLDDQVSRFLILQTTSGDSGENYYGTAVIGTQEDDYASPLDYGKPVDVTCVYNP